MANLLYVVAVVLIIGWVLGFFFFHLGSLIHLLLVVAIVAILMKVIQGKKVA
ncbi:MAG: lmo0937 family membrane protein [Flavisolibacter sp.]